MYRRAQVYPKIMFTLAADYIWNFLENFPQICHEEPFKILERDPTTAMDFVCVKVEGPSYVNLNRSNKNISSRSLSK